MDVQTTIIFTITNLTLLPHDAAVILIKYMFNTEKVKKFGCDKVQLQLPYSPKNETLDRKVGDLPLKYQRTVLTEDELDVVEKYKEKFLFNMTKEDFFVDADATPSFFEGEKKVKILQNIILNDLGPSTSSPTSPVPAKRAKKRNIFNAESQLFI